jgi:hypothetical protein
MVAKRVEQLRAGEFVGAEMIKSTLLLSQIVSSCSSVFLSSVGTRATPDWGSCQSNGARPKPHRCRQDVYQ